MNNLEYHKMKLENIIPYKRYEIYIEKNKSEIIKNIIKEDIKEELRWEESDSFLNSSGNKTRYSDIEIENIAERKSNNILESYSAKDRNKFINNLSLRPDEICLSHIYRINPNNQELTTQGNIKAINMIFLSDSNKNIQIDNEMFSKNDIRAMQIEINNLFRNHEHYEYNNHNSLFESVFDLEKHLYLDEKNNTILDTHDTYLTDVLNVDFYKIEEYRSHRNITTKSKILYDESITLETVIPSKDDREFIKKNATNIIKTLKTSKHDDYDKIDFNQSSKGILNDLRKMKCHFEVITDYALQKDNKNVNAVELYNNVFPHDNEKTLSDRENSYSKNEIRAIKKCFIDTARCDLKMSSYIASIEFQKMSFCQISSLIFDGSHAHIPKSLMLKSLGCKLEDTLSIKSRPPNNKASKKEIKNNFSLSL